MYIFTYMPTYGSALAKENKFNGMIVVLNLGICKHDLAWACQNRMVIGQQKADAKSNEKTVIP